MNNHNKEWLKEQERVSNVVDIISNKQTQLKEKSGHIKENIVTLRKNFWNDVSINLDEPDDIIETQASIKQQAELLSEKERSHGRMYEQMKTLERLHDSPYFGRIDFHEDIEHGPEPIYIGLASLMDKNDEEFLIYDWRAPISSMYYDYTLGWAKYETMEGPIKGEILLKRQYIIKNGLLEGLFDTGLTIGDHLLQQMLGSQSSTKMKSIVATIQKEQNQIIRNEKSKFLVVQGVAGSGKTSAALQRIAYLLYANRETLQAENMLLFSPNPLFNSYVATVLPELGEENMRQSTFQEYAESRLNDQFRLEDPFEQMEFILAARNEKERENRFESIQYKSSLAFKQLIDNHIKYLTREGLKFNDIIFQGIIIVSAEDINSYFYALSSSISIPNRLEIVAEWLLEQLEEQERHEQYRDWVMEEIELLDKEDYMNAYHEAQRIQRDEDETFDDIDQEWEILSANVVEKHFQAINDMVKRKGFVDVKAVYRQIFKEVQSQPDLPDTWNTICDLTVQKLEDDELAWEDVTSYLYLIDQIQGKRSYSHIRYLFIDEAQDYSPFQFAYLQALFPNSRMTILGDINQAIYAHAFTSPSILSKNMMEDEKLERITLMRSYRSTRPIVEFTKQLIKDGERIEAFNRDGNKPTLSQVDDEKELHTKMLDQIQRLQSAGHQTIAIICKTMSESIIAYQNLKSQASIQLMDYETYTFKKGTLVLPAYLAKGIEFDAVIIYNAAQSIYQRESERKLFYTACTRAMHELHLFSVGEKNMFLDEVERNTYIFHK